MALGNTFKLAKLTIEAYKDAAQKKALKSGPTDGNRLEVMYNPETLSTKHEAVHDKRRKTWVHNKSGEVSVKLVFDGTNVASFGVEQLGRLPTVAERVHHFLSMCFKIVPETHEPAFLTLKWGDGIFGLGGFDCRLQSVDIHYTAFDRDGSPLRAELAARFVEVVDPDKKKADERLSSPDLTHIRVVRAGDTLPLLCREIYGSAAHYLRVARVNDLDDFRCLAPGQELIFPPFAGKERR